jgi:hypothetical protein
MKRIRAHLSILAAAGLALFTSGCFAPFTGIFTPVPMPAWVADHISQKILNRNDYRTPILPPLPPGYRPLCEDPPDKAEILRAMRPVCRGVPYFFEEHRDDIEVTVKKLVDVIDPPRFFPLIGPAQLHHCHWECTVYYTETMSSSYPFPFTTKRRRVQVLLIDKDHLHQCGSGPDVQGVLTRDLINGQLP